MYDHPGALRMSNREQLVDRNAEDLSGAVDLVKEQALLATLDVAGRRSGDSHCLREGILRDAPFTAGGLKSLTNFASDSAGDFRRAGSGSRWRHGERKVPSGTILSSPA